MVLLKEQMNTGVRQNSVNWGTGTERDLTPHTGTKGWKENAANRLAGLRNTAWEAQQRRLREQNLSLPLASAVSLKLF